MCGIAGIISKREHPMKLLETCSSLLKHRGPDDEGFTKLEKEGFIHYHGEDSPMPTDKLVGTFSCALVHRRLSILDLSSAGHQPMYDPDSNYAIAHNGEIYNYREIRKELESEGISFISDTDTEVVLKAYIKWGADCQQKFIGMWAFAIIDRNKNVAFLSRDRFGIKPLYYALRHDTFGFSSEIKPLLETGLATREVSLHKLAQYVSYGTLVKARDNLFNDIIDFPPGHSATVDLNTCHFQTTPYYEPGQAKTSSSFNDLFNSSINYHLISDVEVGSCLSGGLDSTAIVTSVNQLGREIKSFTASFPGSDIDEKKYVDMVEGTIEKHYCYPSSADLISDIDRLIYHQELPIGSSSIFAQWSVMKLASEKNIKVLLDGQGADESFGGYYNFAGIYVLELSKKGKFKAAKKAYAQLKQNFTPAMKNATARAGYYYFPTGMQRRLRKQTRLGMKFISPEYDKYAKALEVPDRGGKSFREHSILSLQYGMYDLLRYEDRNSMAFSLESRVPFLDHRLVDYALNLDSSEKIVEGWTKYPIRKYLEPHQPEELVYRKDKIGFATPQNDWKKEVAEHIKAYVQNCDMPDFFHKEFILELCDKEELSNTDLSEFFRLYSVLKWVEIMEVEIV